jgi:hypothetical protein
MFLLRKHCNVMYRQSNNKMVVLSINILNQGSLVKIINEFIAHLPSPPNPPNLGEAKIDFWRCFAPLFFPPLSS